MATLVDLSHTIDDGMITYPGLPGPQIGEHLRFDDCAGHYAPGTEFTIGTITMVSNTGTYLDVPGHRHRGRHDLAALPLDRCADLPTVVVDATRRAVEPDVLPDEDLTGHAVLLRTGWDRHWRTEHYGDPDHPFLTGPGARHLADRGALVVGIDAVNIDDTTDGRRPAHTILLGADVPVVEHLTGLDRLPVRGAVFSAVPVAVRGMATFPVRAYAVVP